MFALLGRYCVTNEAVLRSHDSLSSLASTCSLRADDVVNNRAAYPLQQFVYAALKGETILRCAFALSCSFSHLRFLFCSFPRYVWRDATINGCFGTVTPAPKPLALSEKFSEIYRIKVRSGVARSSVQRPISAPCMLQALNNSNANCRDFRNALGEETADTSYSKTTTSRAKPEFPGVQAGTAHSTMCLRARATTTFSVSPTRPSAQTSTRATTCRSPGPISAGFIRGLHTPCFSGFQRALGPLAIE